MQQALDHLSVLDLSDSLPGQFCARLFADFGADVLLVEPPGGSPLRRIAPIGRDGSSLVFFHLNTGKRTITLDRSDPADRRRLDDLMAGADVIVLTPGEDAAAVAAHFSAAVVVSLSNFGRDGPLAHWKGPEIVLQALSGMMHNNGAHGRQPLYGVGNRAALACGLGGYVGALTALIARDRDGAGQTVTLDCAETAAAMAFPYVQQYLYNGTNRTRADLAVPAGQVRCRDGWVCIWLYPHRWTALLGVVGLPELAHDPRFAELPARRENWYALYAIIQDKVADLAAEDLVDALQRAEIISAKAYRPTEVIASRHLTARGYFEELDGRKILGPPFRLSRTPRRLSAVPESRSPERREALRAEPVRDGGAHSEKPLAGLRVVELTTAWAGPMSGRVLAFFGAEAIHVEGPNRINTWRLNRDKAVRASFPDLEPGDRHFDRAYLFNSQNVNKRSCVLDLKTEPGRTLLADLVAKADVLVCNFRPGTLAKLGLDQATLDRIRPGIIVAELPAFGLAGPMSGYAALGPTMEMATGMSAMVGYAGGQPEVTGPSYLDPIGGFNAAAAILTALIHRGRTGEGQHVEIPQVEAAMQLIGGELLAAAETGTDPVPDGNRVSHAAPHDAYPTTGDDQWIAIAAEDEAQWAALARAIERPDLLTDPRFATLEARLRHTDALDEVIAAWTRRRDKHEAARLLQDAGVAAAPVCDPADVANSAYLAARGLFGPLEHPDAGRHLYANLPFHLGRTPGEQVRAAPCFGADNRYVVETILGRPREEADRLLAAGILTDRPNPGA